MSIEIAGLYTGEPKPVRFGDEEGMTGIYKDPVDGPLWLSFANLQGNDVANTKHHGGEARTVCVYPVEHYAHWNEYFGIELPPGAFGENLTLRGLTEEDVCIGDTFQIGEAVVQVTQARIPCKTIDLSLDVKGLFQQTALQAKSGYFFERCKRVISRKTVKYACWNAIRTELLLVSACTPSIMTRKTRKLCARSSPCPRWRTTGGSCCRIWATYDKTIGQRGLAQ